MDSVVLAGRPVLMGVVNVTPDSFSDGGQFISAAGMDHARAVDRALELARQGAEIVDVGPEASSFHRPGIAPIDAAEQMRRVAPVIHGIRERDASGKLIISVDTRSSVVAEKALAVGAAMINDVSSGEHDPRMFAVAAAHDCPIILMHGRRETPGKSPEPYDNVCDEIISYLLQRAALAQAAGVRRERIFLDPGIGFGKTMADNWRLLAAIEKLVETGYPIVLGVSRKRLLTEITGANRTEDSAPGARGTDWTGRDLATALVTVLAAERGVRVHRVHNVALAAQALAAAARMRRANNHD